MNSVVDNSPSDGPLYNSRVIKTYIQLVRKKYPHVNIPEILSNAGIKLHEVEDQGHWFTSYQTDLLYELLVAATGNRNLARDAGRHASLPDSIGAIRYYVHSFSSPGRFYELIGNVLSGFTRTVYCHSRQIGPERVEITVKPRPGFSEKAYHCENRKGFFEAVLNIFNHRSVNIEHPECIFDGGDVCRYIISWNKSPGDYLRILRNYMLIVLLLATVFSVFYLPVSQAMSALSGLLALLFAAAFFGERFERKNLAIAMQNLQESSEQLVDQIDINYNNTLVTREIGQVVNRCSSLQEVLPAMVEVLKTRLDYDRGMIMLCDPEKKRLRFSAGFGYSKKQEKFLKNIEFHLDKPESKGVFVVSFRDQKPFLINDVNEIEASMSSRSIEFARQMGAVSFICSPIICDNESLGVLAVDNMRSKRLLLHSDMSLLVGVSNIIGVTLRHMQHLEAKEKQLHSVVQVMVSSIDARDPVTKGHSEWVAEYCSGICEELGISKEYSEAVRVAALLHDYGKIGIPDSLLKKADKLSFNEYEYIKGHAEKTYEILRQINFEGHLEQVPEIAASHHERMDGNGYPRGLTGSDIPLGARIIAVADNFEALTASRYYNTPMHPASAIRNIWENAGTFFDKRVVDAFISYYQKINPGYENETRRNAAARLRSVTNTG
ncbi:MAG: HD domain-containing phosphohydrolase [Desulfobacterales bacterium]